MQIDSGPQSDNRCLPPNAQSPTKVPRRLVLGAITGGLAATVVGTVVYRRLREDRHCAAVLSGPFMDYGEYDASTIATTGSCGSIRLVSVEITGGLDADQVAIVFNYISALEPPRTIRVACQVLGKDGSVLGQDAKLFEAYRPKKEEIVVLGGREIYPLFVDVLCTRIPKGKAADIASISIVTDETCIGKRPPVRKP